MIYLLFVAIYGLMPATNINTDDAVAHNYIQTYKEIAIIEMHRTGIPASITLAQALHESNKGTSTLAVNANNHFGIKCKKYWKGETYYHKDDDKNQQGELIESCFRAYHNVLDSYVDHSTFLKNSENYVNLFALARTDYVGWAYGLKRSGYATDKEYAFKLIRNIEKYGLSQYDKAPNPLKKLKRIN